jgi:16S rRNA (guanine527-N7)-methyltransferase
VQIHGGALETLESTTVSAITARAFAPLPKLFACAHRFSIDETIWVLPKGMRAHEEVAAARDSWGGMFHVEHSMSDAEGRIVVASRIQPRELR